MSLARAIDRGLGIGAADVRTPVGVGSAAYGQAGAAAAGFGAESALKISAAWACMRLISETLAMLPLQVFRREADDGRSVATNHPLYALLHDAPNKTAMTALEFRQMLTLHMLLRGNGYALILPGDRGVVDQLIPLVPEQVGVQRNYDRTLTYRVYDPRTRQTTAYDEDELFHVRGLSLDGQLGLSVLSYAATSFGLALAGDQYAARFFQSDARPVGALQSDKELSAAAQERLRASWEEIYGGLNNSGKVAVLEDGLTYVPLSFNPEDSQLLQMREFSVTDIARWFNVPLHMIQSESKDTSWGTGIEQLAIGFVTWTLLPWAKRWEQAISRRLILAPQTFYAEHEMAALLRGDQKTRFESYGIGRQWGYLSVNDIRRLENLQNIGPEGDIYLQPSNMVDAADVGAPPAPAPARLPAAATPLGAQAAVGPFAAAGPRGEQLALVARAAAERVVRKEQAAVRRLQARHAGDAGGFRREVEAFFAAHADWVAAVTGLPAGRAQAWAQARRAEVLRHGATACDGELQAAALDDLTELALGSHDSREVSHRTAPEGVRT